LTPAAPWRLLAAMALCAAVGAAQAGSLRYCDGGGPLTAEQNDRMLRFAGIVKAELDKSGARVALVSRSGLDLGFFGLRYSHAGVSVKSGTETPWAVRQLYFSCDERRPRIFDQGMSAFVLGTHQPELGFLSAVLLPEPAATPLERAAQDNRQALQLLGATYSANAYAFGTQYQNCNQWLVELLAAAWGAPPDAEAPRLQAQAWLRESGFEPTVLDLGWHVLMWAGPLIPWVHNDDHPAQDIDAKHYRVAMPASIEAFVQARLPGATRLEFCHTDKHVVVRRGWDLLPDGCEPGAQDEVIALD
jgi:hypothetical protein